MTQRRLKTTKFTTTVAMGDHKFDLKDEDLVNLSKLSMKGKMIAVHLKTVGQKLQRAICKTHIEDDQEADIIIPTKWDTMSNIS